MTDSSPSDKPPMGASHRLMARLLRQHVRRHAGRLGLAMLCMVAVAGATAANAWIIEPVLDRVFVEKSLDMLLLVTAAVLAIGAVKAGSTYAQAVLMESVGQRIIAETQSAMFGHLMRSDLAFFHEAQTGRLISSFLYDTSLLREAVARAITGIAKDTLTLVFLLGLMFYQDWRLALAATLVLPLAAIAMRRLGARMRRVSTATQEETGALTALMNEAIDGARLVKAYGMEAYEGERVRAAVMRRLKYMLKQVRTRAAATPITEIVGAAAVAVVIFYGGQRVISGATTAGTFFSFVAALLLAYQPLKSLANLNAALQEGLAAAQRIFALLDIEPAIRDKPGARPLKLARGEVRFENVHFAYATGAPALRGVTVEVPAGKTVALVGPSGAGKTTLLNLIPRFFDVSAGAVRIDGVDVRDVTLASLRAAVALVSQESTLFNDSARANIAYGRPGASAAEIEVAARAAAAHDFIEALPEGYDTLVGENGVKLSGGQRQRIAIARAMLKDAPILLLDEATSALDSEAERHVQSALRELMRGRTTLVIAHRLSTVIDADRIYVLDGGRIVEQGVHAELVARGGVYARQHALQFSEEPAASAVAGA